MVISYFIYFIILYFIGFISQELKTGIENSKKTDIIICLIIIIDFLAQL